TDVFLKMEALQPTGSFKIRGIGYACQRAADKGVKHFVASSGGNAGLAVAYAGRQLGLPVTVFLPTSTPSLMIQRIKDEGANIVVAGAVWDDAHLLALEQSRAPDHIYIPPFDLPDIWEGHSTLVDELQEAGLRPDLIVLSVGGGGLLAGVLRGLERLKWTDIPIMTTETFGAASFARSLQAGTPITLEKIDSVAHSLGAKKIADQVFDMAKRFRIHPELFSDRQAVDACLQFADDHRLLVEPACGAALAAAYQALPLLSSARQVLIIVCGGSAVTLEKLRDWQAGLVSSI
ncbi:MAG: pyridoxal-phosphate dependent enzyme, partial [Pseudobdellovibrionaceae bacterium]|nr:pyridoxal-phosphate dependent enzyme [Pseudobdellovibrionaceae bacterium]